MLKEGFKNTITQYFMNHTSLLNAQDEISPAKQDWSMFNDGGVEIEVGEFLYSLVRMIKPLYVFETGTHLGISTSYIAQALHDNKLHGAQISTHEIIRPLQEQAIRLWSDLGLSGYIESKLEGSLDTQIPNKVIDLLFLDSEPNLRFDEFIRFFPQVKDGGFILIHDLHPSMGHHGQIYHDVYDWPYGFFGDKLGSFIKNNEVQTIHFPTPRGFTMFQKKAPDFAVYQYIKGTLNV